MQHKIKKFEVPRNPSLNEVNPLLLKVSEALVELTHRGIYFGPDFETLVKMQAMLTEVQGQLIDQLLNTDLDSKFQPITITANTRYHAKK